MRDRARRAAVRLPPGADELADRDRDGALARGHHRLRRSDLGRPARARRRRRLHRLAPRGRRRDRLSAGAARRRRGGRAARARDRGRRRCACAASPSRSSRSPPRSPIFNFGFVNPTWGGGDDRLAGAASRTSSASTSGRRSSFRGLDGEPAEPGVRLGRPRGHRGCSACSSRRCAAATSGSACSRCARTSGRRPRAAIDVRNVKLIAFGISAFIAGVAGTLYAYNFGSVSADRFERATALSLIAFAYAGGITLVSGAVFAGLIAAQGIVPVRARQVVRARRQLVPAVRRRRPDLHADPEPRGRRRRLLQAAHRGQAGPSGKGQKLSTAPRAHDLHSGGRAMSAVLATQGLSVRFGGVHALGGRRSRGARRGSSSA